MSSKIVISKSKSLFNGGTIFTVLLDGKEITSLLNSSTIVIHDAGLYTVQLKAKWAATQTLIVKVEENSTIYLVIRNGFKYYSKIYFLFFAISVASTFLLLFKIIPSKWVIIVQAILYSLFTLYHLFYFFFKNGKIWVLEDIS